MRSGMTIEVKKSAPTVALEIEGIFTTMEAAPKTDTGAN